ncbi:MAG: twin-arginine translocase TatA/TatE family subunit [Bacteroidales bacterium]|nr:twin-arginine translocase TatA/TatE family subunit [Bacteroidales bacterium]
MLYPLFIGGLGMGEVLVIALIVLLLFGGKKIPELMRGLGTGVKSFKDGMNGIEEKSKEQHRTNENKNNDDNKQA